MGQQDSYGFGYQNERKLSEMNCRGCSDEQSLKVSSLPSLKLAERYQIRRYH